MRLVILAIFLTLVLSACGSDSQSQTDSTQSQIRQTNSSTQTPLLPTSTPISHPLIQEYTPAPINLPGHIEEPIPPIPYEPRLPEDEYPALVQSVNGSEFLGKGVFDSVGSLTISEDRIKLASPNGDTSLIAYRLPEQMQALTEQTFSGGLKLKDTSDIGSMKKETWIHDADGLVFSEIFQSFENPIQMNITNNLAFTQNAVDETETSLNVPAELVLTGPSKTKIPLPLSTPVSVTTDTGEFELFLENSSFQHANPNSTDQIDSYSTHLWVIRLK